MLPLNAAADSRDLYNSKREEAFDSAASTFSFHCSLFSFPSCLTLEFFSSPFLVPVEELIVKRNYLFYHYTRILIDFYKDTASNARFIGCVL